MGASWGDLGAGGVGLIVGYLLGRWRSRWRHITIVMDADRRTDD
jgi:hypothetical protein